MLWLSLGVLLVWLAAGAEMINGNRKLRRLDRFPPATDAPGLPTFTIIVPARNEADTLDPAMRSLLALDYPAFDIVAVDDRSEDGTGRLLDGFDDPRLTVLHVSELPAGWLGKNHALHLGARQATGDWLLFTDADVVFASDTLRRAATALAQTGTDHVTAIPRLTGASPALKVALPVFSLCFALAQRPWRAADPKSRAYVGIGAFNLVRKTAYSAIGGHKKFADAPHDDLALGRAMKSAGFRQLCLIASRTLSVQWYRTLPQFVHGLEKGTFAYFNYRLTLVFLVTLELLGFFLWPIAGLFLLHGTALALDGGATGVMLALGALGAHRLRFCPLYGFAYPLGAMVMVVVLWNAAIRIRLRGGLEWRGTFYPLDKSRGSL
ncbi:MAG: glycosyltransferase [Gammaproteobacteria bacterium]